MAANLEDQLSITFTERRSEEEDRAVAFNVQTEAPPLSEDATGALRIGNSRVLLEIVVRAFQGGATPDDCGSDTLHWRSQMSTLSLLIIYATRMRSRTT